MSIRFENVTKAFGSKTVLKDVSFEVRKGEILFILGKSGVGKSVSLKHMVGLTKPNQGRILIEDEDITPLTGSEIARVRKKCGMVFQHPALLDSLNIFENVSFGLEQNEKIREKVIQTLQLVHLGPEILDKYPPEISYGMQKRVSLARTLAPGPTYLLFDEPTTGLDPITTRAVNDLIRDLSKKLNVTSVVVSHDMGCALGIADRILVLDQGQILVHGTVDEIRNSKETLIQEFLAETLAWEGQA